MDNENHPNWSSANASLRALFPRATGFDLDGFAWVSPELWHPCQMDHLVGDVQCLRHLEASTGALLQGDLVVVAFSSWAGGFGPYFVRYDRLPDFFEEHVNAAQDCIFTAGDAFVLSPATGTLMIHSHHDHAIALTASSANG